MKWILARPLAALVVSLQRRLWLPWALLTVPFLLLFLGLPTREVAFTLDTTQAQPYQGHGYLIAVPQQPPPWVTDGDSNGNPLASTLRLFEDGSPLGRPHTTHADLISKGGGNYSHWGTHLYFAARDNSDPRANGRRYEVRARASLSHTFEITIKLAALVLAALAAFSLATHPSHGLAPVYSGARQRLRTALGSEITRAVGRLVICYLPIAAFMSLFVAPLMTVDSQVLLAFPLNDFVIPHFSVVYPLFGRGLNFLTELASLPFTSRWPSGVYQPQYSQASLTVLIFSQHLTALTAIGYFASVVSNSSVVRFVIVATLYLCSPMFSYSHSALTEAIAFSFLIAAFAELIRLSRLDSFWRGALARFYAFIAFASLTKHVMIVFSGLPLGLLALLLMTRATRMRASEIGYVAMARNLVLGIAVVLGGNHLVNSTVMGLASIEQRSMLGRAFVYRLSPGGLKDGDGPLQALFAHQFFRNDEERQSILADLHGRATNQPVRDVLSIVGRTPHPWVEPWNAVDEYVRTQCTSALCEGHSWAATDRLLGAVAGHAIFTTDVRLWRDIGLRTLQYFSLSLEGAEIREKARIMASRTYWPYDLNEKVTGLNSDILKLYTWTLPASFGYPISINVYCLLFGATLWGLALVPMIKRDWRTSALVASVFGGAAVYAVSISIVTVYLPRYADLMTLLALMASVISVTAPSPVRRPVPGTPDAICTVEVSKPS